MAAESSAASTGLTRCSWKPAIRAFWRSSVRANAVSAIAGSRWNA